MGARKKKAKKTAKKAKKTAKKTGKRLRRAAEKAVKGLGGPKQTAESARARSPKRRQTPWSTQ